MHKNFKLIGITLSLSALIIAGMVWFVDYQATKNSETLLTYDETLDESEFLDGPLSPEELEVSNPEVSNTMNPTAIITTNQGVIELELFADQMPVTVGNFVSLANSDFYDGTKFHRIIDGFMIQGGDPNTKSDDTSSYGTGGSDNIQDEFVAGELLTNTRGSIAMANTGQPNSGSSQFFINLGDNSPLDFDDNRQPNSKHPVFGRVVNGIDVVDKIAKVETGARDIPVTPVIIESIEIK